MKTIDYIIIGFIAATWMATAMLALASYRLLKINAELRQANQRLVEVTLSQSSRDFFAWPEE